MPGMDYSDDFDAMDSMGGDINPNIVSQSRSAEDKRRVDIRRELERRREEKLLREQLGDYDDDFPLNWLDD